MKLLLRWAGHPQESYERVLIAGTKGKGSTGFFLESILEASGVSTGFYSSPHISDPRERIRIGGKIISKETFARAMTWVRSIVSKPGKTPGFTYFEIMTLLAAYCFKKAGVRVGIFEVGLGGRLDATNALEHGLSILTPIHYDHEAVLGHTLTEIAGEKAAVIRRYSPVITGPQLPEAMKVIQKQIRLREAKLLRAEPYSGRIPLEGDFQQLNAGIAFRAAQELSIRKGFHLAPGLERRLPLRKGWPGRMEWLNRGRILIDGAHNPVSIQALVRNLKMLKIKDPVLVFGTSRDKNSEAMLQSLARVSQEIILTPVPGCRSQRLEILLKQASKHFSLMFPAANVRQAMALALQRVGQKRKIAATGSFYLIGEIRKRFYA